LHTARSRNDIDMTMYRMRQREFVAALIEAVLDLRTCLLDLASRHRTSLFAAHTHTQPAQPTTLAHYLLGVIEQLERDVRRLQAAYVSTNRSPLGSCAITGTGFPIDRYLTSDLLGFDGPTGNTYGSIATVDYLLESVSAAGSPAGWSSAAWCKTFCCGVPRSSAISVWPTASCSRAASCRRSVTLWRSSMRARLAAKRSARPVRSC
jgi:hypothetical protein